jgi:hypothetical protein
MPFCKGTTFNGFHPLFFPLFTFVHLYFARQNVRGTSALAYRKDSFFQSVKERLTKSNDNHACINLQIAEAQPLF